MSDQIHISFDGSCLNNPCGQIGYGCVITYGDVVISLWDGDRPHKDNSNNTAEYRGLLLALKWLKSNVDALDIVTIKGDSMLVIKQMTSQWRIKKGGYASDALKAKDLLSSINFELHVKIKFQWIPREQNDLADQLSNMYHQQDPITRFSG